MKKLFVLFYFALPIYGMSQISSVPYHSFIQMFKKSIVPIASIRINGKDTASISGTGSLLLYNGNQIVLTCEHIIAIKDSTNKSIGVYPKTYAKMENVDSTFSIIELKLVYSDEKNDFALLKIPNTKENVAASKKIKATFIQETYWINQPEIKEGYQVLYIGYPGIIPLTIQNNPISRLGIISQYIDGNSTFLIDGFVQHGHSGSPVILIKEKNRNMPVEFETKIIGISTAFPSEYGEIIEPVKSFKKSNSISILNPGFTVVTSMEIIVKAIKTNFK